MARKKIREYDSKRLLKDHLKRLAGVHLQILSAQVCLLAPSSQFPPPVSPGPSVDLSVLGLGVSCVVLGRV
jgi:hypothetical protein